MDHDEVIEDGQTLLPSRRDAGGRRAGGRQWPTEKIPHTAGDYARRSNRQTRLAEQREKEVRTADRFLRSEIEFQAPLRPGSPPAVVLYGDMTKQGLYVYRVKFPAGFKVMPHWHGEERTFVVVSGTLHMGIGESWDETKLKAYPAGSFLSEPPKLPHFTWAKDGEVIPLMLQLGSAKYGRGCTQQK